MNQALHIFFKDVRRHWLEIVVSFLLLFWFGWESPIFWSQESNFGEGQASRWLLGLLGISVCFCWWFLIVRVIQGESLVGDRQFWLTRPYQRRWLMAAKALFIVAFINIPVLIFDIASLTRVGFSSWHHMPGLLQGQFLLTVFLILPVVAISVITESPAQFLLILFAVIAYISGVTWVVGQIPNSDPGGDIIGPIVLIAEGCTCVALIVLQYFRRDTLVSRWTLLGSGCLIAIALTVAPYGFLVERAYPAAPVGSLIPTGVNIDKPGSAKPDVNPTTDMTLELYVPIDTSGLPQGSVASTEAARLTIVGPDGLSWNSGWIRSGRVLWPASGRFIQQFEVSSKFYSSVAGRPVDMRIGLAISEYREGAPKQITVTEGTFKVTDDGICALGKGRFSDTSTLECKSALNEPAFAAHLVPRSTTCTLPDPTWPSMQFRRSDGNTSAEFGGGAGLVPVHPFRIDFGSASDPSGDLVSIICPGTNFSISPLAPFSQYRIETKIRAAHLGNYRSYNF
jgi:hypothetical protein